jgi:hypothetical protein
VKFKTQIIGVVIGALLGLAIAQACATTEQPGSMTTNMEQTDVAGKCAVICTAIASAHCWDSRGVEQLLGPAVEAFNCYDQCKAKSKFAVAIDFECLETADVCTAIDKCIEAGYKKVSFLQSGREYSSPTQPARLSLSNGVYMVDLHDRIADGFADADGLAEDLYQKFTARYADLIANTKNRDNAMWSKLGAPIDLTMGMLDLIPVQRRMISDEWSASMTAIVAASRRQAFLETIMIPLLSVRDRTIAPTIAAAKRMSRGELKAAAKIPTETFRAASERRKSAKA